MTTQREYTQEEKDKFWDALDMAPVNEFFSKLLNCKVNLKKVQGKTYSGRVCYELQDETNIAAENPITHAAWEKMNVETFSSNVTTDKETGELRYWGTINLRYHHWTGGSNGAEIGSIEFTQGKWDIAASNQRRSR